MSFKKLNPKAVAAALLANIISITSKAYAAGMPWESPLKQIETSISGPTARSIAVVAIVAAGLALAWGEGGGGVRRGLWIVFGLSVAFAASSTFISVFNG